MGKYGVGVRVIGLYIGSKVVFGQLLRLSFSEY